MSKSIIAVMLAGIFTIALGLNFVGCGSKKPAAEPAKTEEKKMEAKEEVKEPAKEEMKKEEEKK